MDWCIINTMQYEGAYVPPTLTVDAVLFQLVDSQLMVSTNTTRRRTV